MIDSILHSSLYPSYYPSVLEDFTPTTGAKQGLYWDHSDTSVLAPSPEARATVGKEGWQSLLFPDAPAAPTEPAVTRAYDALPDLLTLPKLNAACPKLAANPQPLKDCRMAG